MFKHRSSSLRRGLFLGLMGLMVATFVFSQHAFAQSSTTLQKPFTVNLGAYFKNITTDAHFLLGLDYALDRKPSDAPFHYGLYADAIFRRSHAYTVERAFVGDAGQDVIQPYYESDGSSGYALGVFGRSYLRSASVSIRPYLGLGVGLYSETIDVGRVDFFLIDDSGHFARNGLGGKLVAGVENRSGVIFEYSYSLFPDMSDTSLRGYGLTVGYRF